jgi:hypothetical protein
MYKSILAIIPLALVGVSQNAVSDDNSSKGHICHNYHEISVASSAVQAHLNHGDIVKETDVPCPQRPGSGPGPEPGDSTAAVVMMRCEAQGDNVVVVSFSASFDFASTEPVEPADCPETLANLLDRGLDLRSVTGGSAETGGALHLYTDYLLIGRQAVASEE